MRCSCITNFFDFTLDELSCGSIYYIDRSTWQEGAEYTAEKTYELKIEHPDGHESVHQVTVGVPLKLDLGECVRPEMYRFSTVSCTKEYFKDYPILCALRCGYLKAAAKLGAGVHVGVLREIRENTDRIQELTSYGDIESARALLEIVSTKLKSINCDCSC